MKRRGQGTNEQMKLKNRRNREFHMGILRDLCLVRAWLKKTAQISRRNLRGSECRDVVNGTQFAQICTVCLVQTVKLPYPEADVHKLIVQLSFFNVMGKL